MKSQVVTLKGELRLKREFICNTCGAIGLGETESLLIQTLPWSGHDVIADYCRKTPGSFPIGWASFVGNVHECPQCLRKSTWANSTPLVQVKRSMSMSVANVLLGLVWFIVHQRITWWPGRHIGGTIEVSWSVFVHMGLGTQTLTVNMWAVIRFMGAMGVAGKKSYKKRPR